MTAPNGKPRGAAASPETVDLYRLLFEAERPLSFGEIASRMPSAYRSHAYRKWREHLEADTVPVKADGWTAAEKDRAWRWWLQELVQTSSDTKRLIVGTPEGGSARGKRRGQLVYSANPDKPPVVRVRELVEVSRYWTPDIGQTGARHAAGMQFLKDAPALLEAKLSPEAKAALQLAITALRNQEPVR